MASMTATEQRFERMVNAYSGDLYRYALFLCREPAQAEDLVQETFLRAWRFLGSLREESKAKSWLMTTVRREFARQFERYRPKFEDADLELIAGAEGIDAESWGLRKAMMGLPEKYRDVLLLQVVGGYNGEEMAGMLGIPRATVNTRLFRARAHLKAVLEGEDAVPPADTDLSELRGNVTALDSSRRAAG